MTSSDHLSLDAVCDLDAGLLPAPEAVRLNAHLTGCSDCKALRDAVTALRTDLAAEGSRPVPVPADVTARVAAAVEEVASAGRRAEAAQSTAVRRRRWLMPAAAAAAILVTGGVGWQVLRSGGTDADTSAVSADMAERQSSRPAPERSGAGSTRNGVPGPLSFSALGEVDRRTIVDEARQLARRSDMAPLLTALRGCADPAGTDPATRIRVAGRPAVLVLHPDTRSAAVYDCRTATRQLLRFSY